MRSCSGALLFLGLLFTVPPTIVCAAPPAVDQYGDPLPPGALARIGTSRLRHSSMVIGVCFAPDGKTLASCDWDNSVRLWDVATAKALAQFPNLGSSVASVHFSPDGKTLGAGTYGGTIFLWDVATRKELRQLQGHSNAVWPVLF